MKINNKPFFTIGIPTYNRSGYLKLAIESILKQDFADYEILIIDNHSIDNTESVVKKYCLKHKNIIYIKNAINITMGSFIKIFYKARGEFLFFLCDDDMILKKNTLSGLYKIIQKNNPGFIKIESLFYFEKISNIVKCFKFDHKNTIIEQNDPYFVEKTFNKFIEFWSGSIYKLEPKLFHLLNTKEWLYTSLDYIYTQIKKYGAVFTGDYCILGRYPGKNNITNLIEPILSLDTFLEVIKKYVSIEDYKRIDENVRKQALFSIINCKLYATNRQTLRYLSNIFKRDKNPFNKIHYYFFSILILLTPKFIFVLLKKFIYHPLLKKEVLNYIKNRGLSKFLK